MDEQNFDYQKIVAVSKRFGRHNGMDCISGLFTSLSLGIALIWSKDSVLWVTCAGVGVSLVLFGLTWRRRQNDFAEYMDAMHEFQAHCGKLESAAKNKLAQ